jgi:hypothetical protein
VVWLEGNCFFSATQRQEYFNFRTMTCETSTHQANPLYHALAAFAYHLPDSRRALCHKSAEDGRYKGRRCANNAGCAASVAIATAVASTAARACTKVDHRARSSTPGPTVMADGGQALAAGGMLVCRTLTLSRRETASSQSTLFVKRAQGKHEMACMTSQSVACVDNTTRRAGAANGWRTLMTFPCFPSSSSLPHRTCTWHQGQISHRAATPNSQAVQKHSCRSESVTHTDTPEG